MLKCGKCQKMEEYDGEHGEYSDRQKYIGDNIKEYRCKSCQDKGHPIKYKKDVYACPQCKLDSESDFAERGIFTPCTACDSCNKWYHRTCLSMAEEDVNDDTKEIFCPDCLRKKRNNEYDKTEITNFLRETEIFGEIEKKLGEASEMIEEIRNTMEETREENEELLKDEIERKILEYGERNEEKETEEESRSERVGKNVGRKRRRERYDDDEEEEDENLTHQPPEKRRKL